MLAPVLGRKVYWRHAILIDHALTPDFNPPPPDVAELFSRAVAAGQRFTETDSPDRVISLVHSAPAWVHPILLAARTQLTPKGNRFCEWGCGMGAVSCLAARMGWEVTGFDREPGLVAAAQSFADEVGCAARFGLGDYDDPASGEIDPFDCDIAFVFVWPAECQRVLERFEAGAAPGTILLLFQGAHEVRAVEAAPTGSHNL